MNNGDVAAGIFTGAFGIIVYLAIVALMIAAMWMIFLKAKQHGWAAIVPIYNIIVLLQTTKQPLWMIVLYFIPIANIVVHIIIMVQLANRFGKSGGFAVGLVLLPVIFLPILGFGKAKYQP